MGAWCILDTVVRPQGCCVGFGGIGRVGYCGCAGVGLCVGVVAGEGDVICWVPVLGCYFDREREGKQVVDYCDYVAAVGDGE